MIKDLEVIPGQEPTSAPDSWAEAVALDPRLAPFTDDPKRSDIVCTLHGHSVVETGCFGYWHCDRCGSQVGDSLGGCHTPPVIRDHDCDRCRAAWEKATFWQRLGVAPAGGGFLQCKSVDGDE